MPIIISWAASIMKKSVEGKLAALTVVEYLWLVMARQFCRNLLRSIARSCVQSFARDQGG